MKSNIAIFFRSLEYMGGIERVIVQLASIFNNAKYNIILLTDTEICKLKDNIEVQRRTISTVKEQRFNQWKEIINENDIKYVIIHDATHPFVKDDINVIHENNAKVILNIHFSFPSPILFNEAYNSYKINKDIGELCDAVATVSKIDSYWWKGLNCNAFHVQNPFVRNKKGVHFKKGGNTLIWIGRHVESKQLEEAIYTFKLIKDKIDNVRLLIVGGSGETKKTKKLTKKLGIYNNIEFIAERADISDLYQRASLHLLTSITESFCLVIAEAKSFGIPTVMYEIPFLELVQGENNGLIQTPRFDRKKLAEATINLLKDKNKLEYYSKQAYESLEHFNDENVLRSWETIFVTLENKGGKREVEENEKYYQIIIKELYDAWNYHSQKNVWKIDFFDNIERFIGFSMKTAINKFMLGIIAPIKRIKNKF